MKEKSVSDEGKLGELDTRTTLEEWLTFSKQKGKNERRNLGTSRRKNMVSKNLDKYNSLFSPEFPNYV